MANNKARLDNHNDIIEAIINTASSLPPYEDVGPETAEYTNLLTEALTEISGKAYYPGQDKTVTAGTGNITVVPDEWHTLASVTVQPTPSQSKTVTPVPEGMTVTPDVGKLLSQVILNGFELPSPEGQYAWKKFNMYPTRTVDGIHFSRYDSSNLQCSHSEVPLSAFVGVFILKTSEYNYKLINESTVEIFSASTGNTTGNTYTVTSYNQSTGRLTVNGISFGRTNVSYDSISYTFNKLTLEFTGDYFVSDNPDAYPDGAEQDGYWYERVSGFEGLLHSSLFSKIAIDKYTFSSATPAAGCVFNHSLGEIPKWALLLIKIDFLTGTSMPTFIFGVQNGNNVGTLTGVSVSGYLDGGIGHSTNTYAFRYGTTTTLQVDNNAFGSSLNFPAGIEHTLITMA